MPSTGVAMDVLCEHACDSGARWPYGMVWGVPSMGMLHARVVYLCAACESVVGRGSSGLFSTGI